MSSVFSALDVEKSLITSNPTGANRFPSLYFQRKLRTVSRGHHSELLLVAAVCSAVEICSCHAPHAGPKLIEADGVGYIACEGAMWTRNDGNLKDPATMNYEIVFKDALGSNHHLTMVQTLKITDLPDNTPECDKSTNPQLRGNPPSGAAPR